MGILDWLRRRRNRIRFEGGSGETLETAIVIRGARFDLVGTAAEFTWLESTFGQKDSDWELVTHSHGKFNGRDVDTVHLRLRDGTDRFVYFDCTESFGK